MSADRLVFPHAKALAVALEVAVTDAGLPPLGVSLVLPGQQAAFDYLDDGEHGALGWVRGSRAFSSSNFPVQDFLRPPGHVGIRLAEEFEVGIVRTTTMGDNGEPVEPAVQEADAALQWADMNVILNTICAYFTDLSLPFILQDYTPYGPAGVIVGGSWGVLAQTGFSG